MRWQDADLTYGVLQVRGTLSRVEGALVISEPRTERSCRDVPLSPATVALLRSVKVSQTVERLQAVSLWVETGHVFTTQIGTAVHPRNALRAISTAAKTSVYPTPKAPALPSSGSQRRWGGENVCHCNMSASGNERSRFGSLRNGLSHVPVGMTGFEPAAP